MAVTENQRRTSIVALVLLSLAAMLYLSRDASTARPSLSYLGSARDAAAEAVKASDKPNDTLVMYAYAETEDAQANLRFMLRHGMHSKVDWIFIMNGPVKVTIRETDNVRVINRPNACYDMGAFGEVLQNEPELRRKYKKFIFMNASIRGPFVPSWSNVCWTSAFTDRVTETVKLVGMSVNCRDLVGTIAPHVQSMILATDRAGLDVLLTKDNWLQCPHELADAVSIEVNTTPAIRDAGYEVDALFRGWVQDKGDFDACTHYDQTWPGQYYGFSISPFETLFVKTKRGADPKLVAKYTEWAMIEKYTAEDNC